MTFYEIYIYLIIIMCSYCFLRVSSKKFNQKFCSFEKFQKDWNPSFSKFSKNGTKGYIYIFKSPDANLHMVVQS
jgi:hypothetical protein